MSAYGDASTVKLLEVGWQHMQAKHLASAETHAWGADLACSHSSIVKKYAQVTCSKKGSYRLGFASELGLADAHEGSPVGCQKVVPGIAP